MDLLLLPNELLIHIIDQLSLRDISMLIMANMSYHHVFMCFFVRMTSRYIFIMTTYLAKSFYLMMDDQNITSQKTIIPDLIKENERLIYRFMFQGICDEQTINCFSIIIEPGYFTHCDSHDQTNQLYRIYIHTAGKILPCVFYTYNIPNIYKYFLKAYNHAKKSLLVPIEIADVEMN